MWASHKFHRYSKSIRIQEIPLWPTIECKIKAFSLLFLLQLHWNGIFVSSFNVEHDSPEKPRTARYVGMSSWIRGRSTFRAQVWLGPYFPRVYIIFSVGGSHAYHFYPCLGLVQSKSFCVDTLTTASFLHNLPTDASMIFCSFFCICADFLSQFLCPTYNESLIAALTDRLLNCMNCNRCSLERKPSISQKSWQMDIWSTLEKHCNNCCPVSLLASGSTLEKHIVAQCHSLLWLLRKTNLLKVFQDLNQI